MAGRILIAGGDPALRIGLRARLGATWRDVQQVKATPEAVKLALRTQPDVVIAVSSLHDPGAVHLCRELRGHPRTRQAGIVAVVPGNGDWRLAALRAGADDALSQPLDELLLMARIRQLLSQPGHAVADGMAEGATPFGPTPRIALIASEMATAIGWRHALAPLISARLQAISPAQALQDATGDKGADLYVIASDLDHSGDGLRLMSELRTRPASRDAGFIIALTPEQAALAPIALDLGAGDVLPVTFRESVAAQEAALRLTAQLTRRRHAGEKRREAERHRLWAMTDPLTGLFNRRHALPCLDEMLAESLRQARPMAVMVLDLDHFKSVNDSLGHAAGDAVLTQIAHRLAQAVQPDDLLARIGGEEFLIARPDADMAAGLALAETMRERISTPPITLPGHSGGGNLRVTASIGLSMTTPDDFMTASPLTGEGLMARADRALLAAKAQGRNRVLVAPLREAA